MWPKNCIWTHNVEDHDTVQDCVTVMVYDPDTSYDATLYVTPTLFSSSTTLMKTFLMSTSAGAAKIPAERVPPNAMVSITHCLLLRSISQAEGQGNVSPTDSMFVLTSVYWFWSQTICLLSQSYFWAKHPHPHPHPLTHKHAYRHITYQYFHITNKQHILFILNQPSVQMYDPSTKLAFDQVSQNQLKQRSQIMSVNWLWDTPGQLLQLNICWYVISLLSLRTVNHHTT